jgi:hypothetical protein
MGRASPSFTPLSTFSSRRSRAGISSRPTIAEADTGPVGASTAPTGTDERGGEHSTGGESGQQDCYQQGDDAEYGDGYHENRPPIGRALSRRSLERIPLLADQTSRHTVVNRTGSLPVLDSPVVRSGAG